MCCTGDNNKQHCTSLGLKIFSVKSVSHSVLEKNRAQRNNKPVVLLQNSCIMQSKTPNFRVGCHTNCSLFVRVSHDRGLIALAVALCWSDTGSAWHICNGRCWWAIPKCWLTCGAVMQCLHVLWASQSQLGCIWSLCGVLWILLRDPHQQRDTSNPGSPQVLYNR